jgi:hypothetical protein
MSLPSYKKSKTINIEPIYKSLYECHFLNIEEDIHSYEVILKSDKLICEIDESKYLKLEDFKETNDIVLILFNKSGHFIKFYHLNVEYDNLEMRLSWDSSDILNMKIIFKINKLTTYNNMESPYNFIKSLKRNIKLDKLI